MAAITQDQAQKRFLTIPPALQDALFSLETTQAIDRIAEANRLNGHRAEALANAVGWVLLGFLHPEEVKIELENAGVPPQAAQEISNEASSKIFKIFGADLEKTYAPLKEDGAGPMVIQGMNTPAPISLKMSGQPLPAMPQSAAGGISQTGKASSLGAPAAAQKPNTLSDVGWSKTQSSGPVVKLDASLVPPTAPVAAAQPQQRPAAPAAQALHGGPVMGEFERLGAMKKAPGAPATAPSPAATSPASPTTPAAEPAPVMLHQDNTFTATGKNTSFTLSSAGGAEVPIPSGKQGPSIPKPAVLEFSNNSPAGSKPPGAPQGVVHYTDYKSPLSSVPTTSAGQRNVSEITAPKPPAMPAVPPVPPVPKPPAPPMTPAPSTAPVSGIVPPAQQKPQGAQEEKVIVKNFF